MPYNALVTPLAQFSDVDDSIGEGAAVPAVAPTQIRESAPLFDDNITFNCPVHKCEEKFSEQSLLISKSSPFLSAYIVSTFLQRIYKTIIMWCMEPPPELQYRLWKHHRWRLQSPQLKVLKKSEEAGWMLFHVQNVEGLFSRPCWSGYSVSQWCTDRKSSMCSNICVEFKLTSSS